MHKLKENKFWKQSLFMKLIWRSQRIRMASLVFTTYLSIFAMTPAISLEEQALCDPLYPLDNMDVVCNSSIGTPTNDTDCSKPQSIGTVAQYRCKNYFVPFDYDQGMAIETTCERNGQWSNILKFNSFLCIEDCGKRRINPTPLLVNGISVNRTFWPWHATIYRRMHSTLTVKSPAADAYTYICGGTIIRNSIILTAAHCVTERNGRDISALDFKIGLGVLLSNFNLVSDDPTVQILNVKRIYVSDGYDLTKDYQSDIAIIHLDGDVRFNEYVSPVCLPTESAHEVDLARPGKFGQVAGFGIDETGNPSQVFKFGELEVQTRDECFERLNVKLSESQMCAGTLLGVGKWRAVCVGDSGGGLIFPSPVHEKYYLYGTTSFTNRRINVKTTCQSHAVFTRVVPFMTWIRAVIEQIHGATLKELIGNSRVPYFQRGVAPDQKQKFSSIPPELDDRVTSIELANLLIDPSELLKSLKRTKLLQVLNISNSRISEQFNERIRLPHLQTFILDLTELPHNLKLGGYPQKDPNSNHEGLNRKSKLLQFFESMLFFDKDFKRQLKLKNVLQSRVNIVYNFDYYKIINTNYVEGRILLTQVPNTNEILQRLPSDFKLRHLALSSCDLNLTEVKLRPHIESLVLNNIREIAGAEGLSDVISELKTLKELTINADFSNKLEWIRANTIYLSELPPNLGVLSLTNVVIRQKSSPASTSSSNRLNKHSQLKSFYCEYCEFIPNRINVIFENLETLVLKTHKVLNIEKIFQNMPRLTSVYLTSEIYEYSQPVYMLSNDLRNCTSLFEGIGQLLRNQFVMPPEELEYETEPLIIPPLHLVKSVNESWVMEIFETDGSFQNRYKGLSNFYTSLDELQYMFRLQGYEKRAINSGYFVYDGERDMTDEKAGVTCSYRQFPETHFISDKIKILDISNVQVNFKKLVVSLESYTNAVSLNLTNMYLHSLSPEKIPSFEYFRFHISNVEDKRRFPDLRVEVGTREEFVKVRLLQLIPFEVSESLFPVGGVQALVFSIEYQSYKIVSVNVNESRATLSHISFMNEVLSNWNETYVSVRDLTLCHASSLDTSHIPSTVSSLHLSSVTITHDLGFLLKRLVLTNLRVIDVMVEFSNNANSIYVKDDYEPDDDDDDDMEQVENIDGDEDEGVNEQGDSSKKENDDYDEVSYHANKLNKSLDVSNNRNRRIAPEISLSDLNNTALRDLALTYVHITYNNDSWISFDSLETLYLDTCIIEEFLLQRIWDIFPAPVVAIRIDVFKKFKGYKSLIPQHEKLMLSALLNRNIKWIFGTFFNDWAGQDEPLSGNALRIQEVLRQSELFNAFAEIVAEEGSGLAERHDFAIERKNGVWTYVKEGDSRAEEFRFRMVGHKNAELRHYNCEREY